MTYAELRAAIDANEHQHALDGVALVRYRMLEGQLARAVEARKAAERELFEFVCNENDEMNRLRAENRRLMGELDLLRRALSSAAPSVAQPVAQAVEVNPPRPYQPNRGKKLPMKSGAALRNSELVQRALRNDPFPEPPEPGTYDPTITEEDLRDHGL